MRLGSRDGVVTRFYSYRNSVGYWQCSRMNAVHLDFTKSSSYLIKAWL